MAKKSLQEFISHYRNNGFVFGSHFYVEISGADEITNMYCEGVNLPGINIATAEVRLYGENREVPYMPLYPNLTLTFLVDASMGVKSFFDRWVNEVIDQRTREVGFYNQYAKTMDIYVLDKLGKILYKIKAREVYPKAVADIRFDSNNRDIVKLDVTFAMKYWETEEVDVFGNTIARLTPPKQFSSMEQLISGYVDQAAPATPGNFTQQLTRASQALNLEAVKSGKAIEALTATGPLASFGQTMNQVGQYASKISNSLNGVSQGLTNIVAPVSALSNNIVGLSSLMGTLNGVTNSLGLGTPFSGAQAALNKAGGQLSAVANLNGLPGALTSTGSSLSTVGAAVKEIAPSISTMAKGSTQVLDSIKSMGSAFSQSGDTTQESASSLQTEINQGKH